MRWSKKDWGRFWLHFPVGCLCSWLSYISPVQGVLLTVYFLTYEVLNDWRKVDRSYKDVIGGAFGFGVTAIIIGLRIVL